MSDTPEFFKKADQFFQFYYEAKYSDALAAAEDVASEYPEKDAHTAFWLLCLQNMTGNSDAALQTFRDALARGVWWAESQLREDTDLATLQGNQEFERLVSLSEQMHAQAEINAKPEISVCQPDGKGPFPLLIVLGPRGGYPELDLRDWSPVIKLGWMLALPLSTQMASPLSHIWDDREKALHEIVGHYERLIEEHPIDKDRIVIAGFSQGATRAVELVMSRRLKVRGFFAVVPGSVDLAELEGWSASGVGRGVLISGGRDSRYELFIQIKEVFERHHLPLLFENFPEMAHQIPSDFEPVLKRGFDFLLKDAE